MARGPRPFMFQPFIQEEFVDLGVNPYAAQTGLQSLDLTDDVVDAIVNNLLQDRDNSDTVFINGRSSDDIAGDMADYLLSRAGDVKIKTVDDRDLYPTGVTPETPIVEEELEF